MDPCPPARAAASRTRPIARRRRRPRRISSSASWESPGYSVSGPSMRKHTRRAVAHEDAALADPSLQARNLEEALGRNRPQYRSARSSRVRQRAPRWRPSHCAGLRHGEGAETSCKEATTGSGRTTTGGRSIAAAGRQESSPAAPRSRGGARRVGRDGARGSKRETKGGLGLGPSERPCVGQRAPLHGLQVLNLE